MPSCLGFIYHNKISYWANITSTVLCQANRGSSIGILLCRCMLRDYRIPSQLASKSTYASRVIYGVLLGGHYAIGGAITIRRAQASGKICRSLHPGDDPLDRSGFLQDRTRSHRAGKLWGAVVRDSRPSAQIADPESCTVQLCNVCPQKGQNERVSERKHMECKCEV